VPHDGPIGRERELVRIDSFLAAVPEGLQTLAITGPAGIGKTTVWAESVRRGRELGWLVLSAQPSGAEARLSYAGLGDLLSGVENTAYDALPNVQRRALGVALLREDPGSAPLDGRAVAAALLSLLSALAETTQLLVAVDDAQWLDTPSAEALSFAVRRLADSPVGVAVSVRVEQDRPPTFERSVPADRRTEIELGNLSVAALHDVLRDELGAVFPRPTLVRIAEASEGNPFYALEIARELERMGVPAAGSRLPVPEEVRALTRSRLARLPEPTQEALLVASCLSRPTTAFIDVEALAPAEEDGVVRVDETQQVRFTHPLLASAVYEAAPAGKRRRVHRSLAEQLDDPEERARHLALTTDGPDETVARALDAAAEHAAGRGASAAAAELARRALELTAEPSSDIAVRRALAAAHFLLHSGDSAGARALLEDCDPEQVEGDLRAELLLELGGIAWYERTFQRGHEYLLEALEHARSPELAAAIHIQAAWLAQDFDPLLAIEHSDAVLELVDPDESPGRYSQALLHGTFLRLTTGQGADADAYERGLTLQEQGVAWDETSPVIAIWPLFKDDFAQARSFYEGGLPRARAEGDETSVQATLLRLTEIELWTGNWARADELATEGMELADRISSYAFLGSSLYARGLVDAHLGRIEEAREAGKRILELFDREGQRALGHWVLGFLALSLDDPAGADEQLTQAAATIDTPNQHEPARVRFHPDQVEAVIQVGDLDRAETLIEALEERGKVFPRPWILATTARCRGLLLSARGDLDGARAAMEEALEHHTRLDMPFERARTLLAFGQLRRRRKEKREARAAIEEALGVFEELPAPLWAERARAELARVPVRRAPSELTATEETIARLAETGLTNSLIAKRIFVSPKTVESNLSRVYRKLGIRSRAELGRAMVERDKSVKT
jgi:DNA-binding CsgD family transcriptional regulator